MDEWDDYCYECTGYGDNYGYDEDGNDIWLCPDCPMNPENFDDE